MTANLDWKMDQNQNFRTSFTMLQVSKLAPHKWKENKNIIL